MWVAENTLYCKVKRYWCDHESCEECERIMKERIAKEKEEEQEKTDK
jgi:hypothetical protein